MKWYVRPGGGVFLLQGSRLIAWSRRIDPKWIAEQEGLDAELRYSEYREAGRAAEPQPQRGGHPQPLHATRRSFLARWLRRG